MLKNILFLIITTLIFTACTPQETDDSFSIDYDSTGTTYRDYPKSGSYLVNVNNVFKAKVTKNGVIIADETNDTSLCFHKNNALVYRKMSDSLWSKILVGPNYTKVSFGKDSFALIVRSDVSAFIKYNNNRKYYVKLDTISLQANLNDSIFQSLPDGLPYNLFLNSNISTAKEIKKIDNLLSGSNEYYTFRKWKAKVHPELKSKYFN